MPEVLKLAYAGQDPCEYVNNMKFINQLSEHDWVILYCGRKYVAGGIYADDFRDELEVRAECEFLGTDSYGVDGSEFSVCRCENEKLCKFAGSEFKHWDKSDPDISKCSCLIDIKFSGLGKKWSLEDKEE